MQRLLLDLPESMAALPRDKQGFPVPAFIDRKEGEAEHRRAKPGWHEWCAANNLCWVCNELLGVRKWFVMDPDCSITRIASEPPCHSACAHFVVKNCPFLTRPGMKIDSPGVRCVWESHRYVLQPHPRGGSTFNVCEPDSATFWRDGRKATKLEVLESTRSGVGLLFLQAEVAGPVALHLLGQMVLEWRMWLEDFHWPADNDDHKPPDSTSRAVPMMAKRLAAQLAKGIAD